MTLIITSGTSAWNAFLTIVTCCTNWRLTLTADITCARRCSWRRGQCTAPTARKNCGQSERWSSSRVFAAASATGLYGPAKAAAAIIGHANLNLGDNVERVLDALQAASPNRFRGIRQSVGWDPHPEIENRGVEHQLASADFRAGAQVLARRGLVYENTAYFPQLGEVAEFANAVPDLTIISNHIGGLMRVGPYGNRDDEVLPAWREGIATLAKCPNVVMKLGGVGQPRYGFDWHTREKPIGSEELAEALSPLMTYCIDQFGPERCMFESNFPPDKVSYSYNVMYNAFKRMTSGYSVSERAAMFHDNAVRVYNIDV